MTSSDSSPMICTRRLIFSLSNLLIYPDTDMYRSNLLYNTGQAAGDITFSGELAFTCGNTLKTGCCCSDVSGILNVYDTDDSFLG